MSLPEYDEYERIEIDHDEQQVLDDMMAHQADEQFRSWHEEQEYIRAIENTTNTFYWPKGMEGYAK